MTETDMTMRPVNTERGLETQSATRRELRLNQNDVHVWFAHLASLRPCFESFFATLAKDEIERAERFKVASARERYVLGRGLLREILSRYCGIAAAALRFRYGTHGKPALAEAAGLLFNDSHTHGAVICAVARDCEIGIDLEHIREDVDDLGLAEQYFSAAEAAALARIPVRERQKAFLTCWTRKEAYIKARGEGLSMDLRSFEVFESVDAPVRLRIRNDPEEACRWSLMDLDVPAGYLAALVAEGQGHRVTTRVWPGAGVTG
jgi:4'-phosphopantetheinyl transferase